jgi:hypothetical protein
MSYGLQKYAYVQQGLRDIKSTNTYRNANNLFFVQNAEDFELLFLHVFGHICTQFQLIYSNKECHWPNEIFLKGYIFKKTIYD